MNLFKLAEQTITQFPLFFNSTLNFRADYVGLDTTYNILKGWAQKYPDNPMFAESPLLEKLVSAGKLGVKSGEGFYEYKQKK